MRSKKNTLRSWQEEFQKAILSEISPSKKTLNRLGIQSTENANSLKRMEVYRYAIFSRARNSVLEDLERTVRAIGKIKFIRYFETYLRAHDRNKTHSLLPLTLDFADWLLKKSTLKPKAKFAIRRDLALHKLSYDPLEKNGNGTSDFPRLTQTAHWVHEKKGKAILYWTNQEDFISWKWVRTNQEITALSEFPNGFDPSWSLSKIKNFVKKWTKVGVLTI